MKSRFIDVQMCKFGLVKFISINPKIMTFKIAMASLLTLLVSCQQTGKKEASKHNPLDEKLIREVLDKQVMAWNETDIEGFMQGYWKSDSLLFIGSKITNGWDSTLARYKRSYPDKAAMGNLRFEIMRIDFISSDSYLVTGKYFLKREKDSPSGVFTLLFRKKNGLWVVVYDHTA
jgi:ketosteroid isomerase-like protein